MGGIRNKLALGLRALFDPIEHVVHRHCRHLRISSPVSGTRNPAIQCRRAHLIHIGANFVHGSQRPCSDLPSDDPNDEDEGIAMRSRWRTTAMASSSIA